MTRSPAGILLQAVVLLLASIGVLLGGRWVATLAAPESALQEITSSLSGGLALTAFVCAGVAMYQANAAARDVRLRLLFRDPIVMSSLRTSTLTKTLRTMPQQFRNGADRPTYGFTVVGDDRGISFWGGDFRKPLLIWELPWDRVLEISETQVAQATRSTRGISLRVLDDHESEQIIGLVAVGAGIGGLFEVRRGVREALRTEFEARRSAHADQRGMQGRPRQTDAPM